MTPDQQPLTVPDASLQAESLASLGLVQADMPQIIEISQSLQDLSPGALHVFGQQAGARSAAFGSELLEHVRNRDLDEAGARLGEVVRIARELKLDDLGERSRVPLLGALIDRMRASKDELVQKFSDTNRQISTLMADVGHRQQVMAQRVTQFDRMFELVSEEYRTLGLHVAAGKLRLGQLRTELATLAGADDPASRTRAAELEGAIRILDKRVGDLGVMQHAAHQTLPMVRLIQANAIQLIEKFNVVRDLTIPSWKRQFAIQLSLDEQKQAVGLANAIDDATNDLMRRNAELMRQTSVETAKANQRAVIDVETLRHVHEQLISTVEEVRDIHQRGIQQRQETEVELARMREELERRLGAAH